MKILNLYAGIGGNRKLWGDGLDITAVEYDEKIAAIDMASATETVADGVKRAKIKEAEGAKQAKILQAEGEAEAIRLVNEAAEKYFIGNAQILRKLQALETSLQNNTKVVVPEGSDLVNVIGEMAGVAPLPGKK